MIASMKLSFILAVFYYFPKTLEFTDHKISLNEGLLYLLKHIKRKSQYGYYKILKSLDFGRKKLITSIYVTVYVLCQQKMTSYSVYNFV